MLLVSSSLKTQERGVANEIVAYSNKITKGRRSLHDGLMTSDSIKSMMILIAGPYRSGTNDDSALIQRNVREMESYALPIFRAGHIPILGEWLALPLVELAGSKHIGDDAFNEVFHPIAIRLLEKCDAVLRVGGASAGADEMVRVGRRLGLRIYKSLEEVPTALPRR
jgi:hypothetical protein